MEEDVEDETGLVAFTQPGKRFYCLPCAGQSRVATTSGARVNELACHRIVAGASVKSLAGVIDLLSLSGSFWLASGQGLRDSQSMKESALGCSVVGTIAQLAGPPGKAWCHDGGSQRKGANWFHGWLQPAAACCLNSLF